MSQIKIGKIYKNAFASVIKVVNACNITNVLGRPIKIISDKEISYGENSYVFDENINACESTDFNYKFNPTGANWFEGLRKSENVNSFDSEWKELIENVALIFHQEYSYFDFNQAEYQDDIDSDNERRNKMILVVNRLFPNLESSKLKIESDTKSSTGDVYGAILKLEINDGTGEAQTILCKVYFDKVNDKFNPILASDAIDINESFLKTASTSDDTGLIKDTSLSDEKRRQTIRDAATQLSNALVDLMTPNERNFEDYYFLHHKSENKNTENGEDNRSEDEKILDNIIEKAPSLEYVDIYCKKVSLLAIIHAKWKRYVYKIKYNGIPTLNVRFGLKNKLSLRCLVCGSNKSMVINDSLVYHDNGELKQISIFKDNGEFINNLDDYIAKSRIKDHLFKMDSISNACRSRCRNFICNKIVCVEQLAEFENGEKKCKSCQYPEVVYVNKAGNPIINKNLIYLSDADELIKSDEDFHKCKLCKRNFLSISTSGLCQLCEKAMIDEEDNKDDVREYKKIYKAYSKLLPLHSRTIIGKKRGYEDNELLILKIKNNNLFLVDKLSEAKNIKITKVKKEEIKKILGGE